MDKNKKQTTVTEATAPARKPRKRRSRSYAVTNEELLYKLAATAGLLCMMRGLTNKVIDQFNTSTGRT